MQRHLILSVSDTFLIWTFPQVGTLPLWSLRMRVKQAQRIYCVSTRTERVLLFGVCDANSRIVNITRGPRIHNGARRGDCKSESLRKRKAVTPHRSAKRPRLFQADQQETELRQRRTFRKWRHNLAVYYAVNMHGKVGPR